MIVEQLWLKGFRNYEEAHLVLDPEGLTVLMGPNGAGKTNLLEAVAYLGTLRSFRRAPREALIANWAERSVLRAEARRGQRRVLIEAEIARGSGDRVQINRQPLRRSKDLAGIVSTTVFAPDDLALVKGGPEGRRDFLDEVLMGLHPRHEATRAEFDRVLRQRNTLLKSLGAPGRLRPPEAASLDAWDAKLTEVGETLASAREGLASALAPLVAEAYGQLAHVVAPETSVGVFYRRSWEGGLARALERARGEDLRRGVTTVGPHHDELHLSICSAPARTHASQGEQRCLALALRLAAHRIAAASWGSFPTLLLDDVFSELDSARSAALVECLPAGQAVLATTGPLPAGVEPALVIEVEAGKVLAA